MRARLVHELTTGFYVKPSRMLLSEWLVDHWLPVRKTRVKKTTYRAYRSAIVHRINPRIGGGAIGKLKTQVFNSLYQQLLADGRCDGECGLAPATVSGVHVVLRKALTDAEDAAAVDPVTRRHYLAMVQQRVGQARFRETVLDAYSSKCTLRRLRHRGLLDAAHIVSYAEGGTHQVSNGIPMCRIHHASYDSDIGGVRPDGVAEVRKDVLEESG